MEKVIVTGGAGFIGSHLSELLSNKYQVIIIDNFSTGRRENLTFSDVKVIESDICETNRLEEFFYDVTYVFHIAALADLIPSIEKPKEYFRSNVEGTLSILELAKQSKKLKKFLYAASSSCYGIPNEYPTKETTQINPEHPYAITKWLGEELVMNWGKIYSLPVISLRLFNVFGPKSRTSGTYGAVFGVFLKQKLSGLPFTVVGNGEQTRDFTYVTDIAKAFLMAAESNITHEIFNVGSGGTYSINYLVELLGGSVIHIPKRPGEPDCTFADISKIKNKLGWSPQVSFEEGVKKVLENIDYWRNAPLWTPEKIEKVTINWFKHLGKK